MDEVGAAGTGRRSRVGREAGAEPSGRESRGDEPRGGGTLGGEAGSRDLEESVAVREARARRDAELESSREALSGSRQLADSIVVQLREVQERLAREHQEALTQGQRAARAEARGQSLERSAASSAEVAQDLRARLRALQADRDRLAVEEESARRLRDELREQVRVLLEDNARLEREREALGRREEEIGGDLSQAREDLAAAGTELAKARTELLALSAEATRLRVQNGILTLERDSDRKRVAFLEVRNQELADEADALREEGEGTSARLQAAEARSSQLRDASRTLASAAALVGAEVLGRKTPDEADLPELVKAVEGICWGLRDAVGAQKDRAQAAEAAARTLLGQLEAAREEARTLEGRLVLGGQEQSRSQERVDRLQRQVEAAKAAQERAQALTRTIKRKIATLVE